MLEDLHSGELKRVMIDCDRAYGWNQKKKNEVGSAASRLHPSEGKECLVPETDVESCPVCRVCAEYAWTGWFCGDSRCPNAQVSRQLPHLHEARNFR